MGDEFPRTGGRLRRRIALHTQADGAVVAWVEDDFHHFGLTLEHDGGTVTNIASMAARAPWSTCPLASEPLRALIGKQMSQRASDIGTLIDMRMQCTHLFDLAGLAMAHACARRDRRDYEMLVPDRACIGQVGRERQYERAIATLSRDGQPMLAIDFADPMILGPDAYAGRSFNAGFRAWIETLPLEEAEMLFVLRRAIMVAGGRMTDLDRFDHADDIGMPQVCYTMLPANRFTATRNKGTMRNYADSGEAMLGCKDIRPQ